MYIEMLKDLLERGYLELESYFDGDNVYTPDCPASLQEWREEVREALGLD